MRREVNLTTNVRLPAATQGDNLSGIGNLTGSAFADALSGDGAVNRIDCRRGLASWRQRSTLLIGGVRRGIEVRHLTAGRWSTSLQ